MENENKIMQQYFFEYCKSISKASKNSIFTTIVELRRNPLRQNFLQYIEEGHKLGIKYKNIPENIDISVIALACMDLSVSDEEIFDLKDKETRGFLNETKVMNRWNISSNLCENATYEL